MESLKQLSIFNSILVPLHSALNILYSEPMTKSDCPNGNQSSFFFFYISNGLVVYYVLDLWSNYSWILWISWKKNPEFWCTMPQMWDIISIRTITFCHRFRIRHVNYEKMCNFGRMSSHYLPQRSIKSTFLWGENF